MVFEGVNAAAKISAQSSEQQGATIGTYETCQLQAGQKPSDSISVCNNPFFDDSGNLMIARGKKWGEILVWSGEQSKLLLLRKDKSC